MPGVEIRRQLETAARECADIYVPATKPSDRLSSWVPATIPEAGRIWCIRPGLGFLPPTLIQQPRRTRRRTDKQSRIFSWNQSRRILTTYALSQVNAALARTSLSYQSLSERPHNVADTFASDGYFVFSQTRPATLNAAVPSRIFPLPGSLSERIATGNDRQRVHSPGDPSRSQRSATTSFAAPAPARPGRSPHRRHDFRSSRRGSDRASASFWDRPACRDSRDRTGRSRGRTENRSHQPS